MENTVNITYCSTCSAESYYFDIVVNGESYEGTLTIRTNGKYDRDEEVTVLFDDDDLSDEQLEQFELLVMEKFYSLDTNKN
jgi:hypothetical protein